MSAFCWLVTEAANPHAAQQWPSLRAVVIRKAGSDDVALVRKPKYTRGMKIEDFLKLRGVTDAEWSEWLQVSSAPAPEQRSRIPDPSDGRLFINECLPPSGAYLRAGELRSKFTVVLSTALAEGRWRVSGRTGSASTRQDLERTDWTDTSIDFARDRIGGYKNIVITEIAAETTEDQMRRFIETVCSVAIPRQSLSKALIQDLAERLFPDTFQKKAFLRGWDKANIIPGWRKAGPPRQSDSD